MIQETGYDGAAKQVADERHWDKIMTEFAQENNMRVVDFTETKLKELNVTTNNLKKAMRVVVRKLCEFYGLKLWELQHSRDVKEKYGISEAHFRTILENSDVGLAYNQYKRQYLGDPKTDDMGDPYGEYTSNIEAMIPKSQITPDIKGHEKIYELMMNQERSNLERMIKVEQDPKKKKLLEAQLVVLDLKQDDGE